MKLATMKKHEPPMHLGFWLLRCCVTKSTSPRLSVCTCNWESRSPEPLCSTILNRERANKVLGKKSLLLLNPLHQVLYHSSSTSSSIASGVSSHLPWTSSACARSSWICCCRVSHIRTQLSNYVLHIKHIDLYRHDLAYNMLQCFLFIIVIDLSSTFDSTVVLFCNSLFMFMIYF
jgi:hypothetical protein